VVCNIKERFQKVVGVLSTIIMYELKDETASTASRGVKKGIF
jgi:hypothetical protein